MPMSWFLSQDPISNVKVTVKVIVNQFKFGVLFLTSFFSIQGTQIIYISRQQPDSTLKFIGSIYIIQNMIKTNILAQMFF